MGPSTWEAGVTADPVGGDSPRRADFLKRFGYALEVTPGLPCPICGGAHLETVHAPSTDALRAGADLPTPAITFQPVPPNFIARLDSHADEFHYTPPPEVLNHADNALFSDDAERRDDAARKARRARLVAEHGGGVA